MCLIRTPALRDERSRRHLRNALRHHARDDLILELLVTERNELARLATLALLRHRLADEREERIRIVARLLREIGLPADIRERADPPRRTVGTASAVPDQAPSPS